MMILNSFTIANDYNFGVQWMANSHQHWFCYKLIVIVSPGTDFVKNYES